MSIFDFSSINGHDNDHRASSKRKLEDYASSASDDSDASSDDDLDFSNFVASVRMRKDETLTSSSSTSQWGATWPTRLQFFIRTISGGNHIVVQFNAEDTVGSLHERLQLMTGIPMAEQRLLYNGKQLQWEQSLFECSIQNDAVVQLVGRMRSTRFPKACQLINDMVAYICGLCKMGMSYQPQSLDFITTLIGEVFNLAPKDNSEEAREYFRVFSICSGPAALVMLYASPRSGNKQCACTCIGHFLSLCKSSIDKKPLLVHCLPVVLEFCKLLRNVACHEDPLYRSCRSCFATLLGHWLSRYGGGSGSGSGRAGGMAMKEIVSVADVFLFVRELASSLCKDLELSENCSTILGPLEDDVNEFSAFLVPFVSIIKMELSHIVPIAMPLGDAVLKCALYVEEVEQLYVIYLDLLAKMGECLGKMEEFLHSKPNADGESICTGWSQHLILLRELHRVSMLYKNAEDTFWSLVKLRKASVCSLVVRYANRTDDHQWLHLHKDITNFQSRRHLAMIMFPEVKDDYDELHEMLIDRAHLLSESYEYIARAETKALHNGLFMEFKNEEATGPGVLREWFLLVVQAIFNQENALFVACPNDRRRFYPNPASKVNPMHLEYFAFSGRVIALALMHKVQIGIVFDRLFFLQLAGTHISLEDIKEADPWLYNSCKQILEMDAEVIDSDDLGLSFAREFEELGSVKVVELRPNGKNIVVNSKNREEYVNLLIQHRFVTSISDQVSHFANGFADILSDVTRQKFFFQSLEHEDLDKMLYGSESAICLEDWKAHTEYNGFQETDAQITWFWQIVKEMSSEQRRVLLFFWTSIKYLPLEGFRGLASRLYIYKSSERHERLPSSHTCFYRLCFPPYSSMAVMQDRFRVITQEHVGCSFGTW